jgi:hypothetical protein
VSTAIRLPRSCKADREVEATPWVRTWFSIDPQPASISPTINISIVFICAFPVDCGQIICHPAIKNDSSAILRSFGLRCGALLWRIPRDVETRLRRKFKRCVYCRRRFKRGVYNDSATIEASESSRPILLAAPAREACSHCLWIVQFKSRR